MIRLNKKSLLLIASFLGAGVLIKNYYLEAGAIALTPAHFQKARDLANFIGRINDQSYKLITADIRNQFLNKSTKEGLDLSKVQAFALDETFFKGIPATDTLNSRKKYTDYNELIGQIRTMMNDGIYWLAQAANISYDSHASSLAKIVGANIFNSTTPPTPILNPQMSSASNKNIGGQNTAFQQMKSNPTPAVAKTTAAKK